MLLAFLACRQTPEPTPAVPADPFDHVLVDGLNHLLPLQVAVDPGARRAWSYSSMLNTVAEVDLDSRELVDVFAVREAGKVYRLNADQRGGVWVVGDEEVTHWVDGVETESRPGGNDVLPSGEVGGADGVWSGDNLIATDGEVLTLLDRPEGWWAVLEDGRVVDDRLDPVCELPFGHRTAALIRGDVWVAATGRVGSCGGLDTPIGNDVKTVLEAPEGVVLLDRVSDDNPTRAVVRRLQDGREVETTESGKNSGFGGYDGDTLWVNSEGSTELIPVGEPGVRLGTHVESPTVHEGVVYVSGRLSNTLLRIDGDDVLETNTVRWPVAPVVADGRLFVLAQLDMMLIELDPATLEVLAEHDLGVGANDSLLISDLAYAQGALWVSDGRLDAVLRVDLDGAVTGEWVIGDPGGVDAPGRLELVADDDDVFLIRSRDGRVVRLDDELFAARPTELQAASRMQLALLDELLWVGEYGLDRATLEIAEVADWTVAVGVQGDRIVAWYEDDGTFRLGDDVVATDAIHTPQAVWDGSRVVYADPAAGRVVAAHPE